MIISLSGEAGSGKSTLAKKLAKKLGWPRYYIGGIRREMAAKHKMTLEEYNKLGETDPSTDIEPDNYVKKLGQTKDNFIIEGRVAWYFIPQSFKIYLSVDERAGAERVFSELQKTNTRNEATGLATVEDVLRANRKRKKSDQKRYAKYYDINAYDPKNYDFVLDTSKFTPQQTFKKVYAQVKKKLNNLK